MGDAVAGTAGRMVVAGIDAARAVAGLICLAPRDSAAAQPRQRAAGRHIAPTGAADTIAAALERG